MQAKHVRDTPAETRYKAVYLQEVILEKNKSTIEERILEDITTVNFIIKLHFFHIFRKIIFV